MLIHFFIVLFSGLGLVGMGMSHLTALLFIVLSVTLKYPVVECASVVPPPWADPKRNPCANRPGSTWQMLHWPADDGCYQIYKVSSFIKFRKIIGLMHYCSGFFPSIGSRKCGNWQQLSKEFVGNLSSQFPYLSKVFEMRYSQTLPSSHSLISDFVLPRFFPINHLNILIFVTFSLLSGTLLGQVSQPYIIAGLTTEFSEELFFLSIFTVAQALNWYN